MLLIRMGREIMVHGFRSSFNDWAAEHHYPDWVSEKRWRIWLATKRGARTSAAIFWKNDVRA
jgi:hypothetical protein